MQDINIKELLKKDNARIKWVDYGVANTFTYNYKNNYYKVIEINKDILDENELFIPILFHELRHSKKIFATEDIVTDFSYQNLKSLPNLKIINFMIKHPRALTQFLPLYYTKKKGMVIDINLTIIWIIAISLGVFIRTIL